MTAARVKIVTIYYKKPASLDISVLNNYNNQLQLLLQLQLLQQTTCAPVIRSYIAPGGGSY